VSGLSAAEVGDMARSLGVALHELTTVRASLEDAFMELTDDAVEYRTTDPRYQAAATSNRRELLS
jgi:ABC-2 type transport system ATP-binding protein